MYTLSRKSLIFLAVVATTLIMLGNFYLWMNRYVYDKGNFKNISTNAILADDSRQAISREIVDEALKNEPIIEEVAGPRLESVIAGLLESSISRTIVEKMSSGVQELITSPKKEEVSINLTTIKSFIKPLYVVVSSGEDLSQDINKIPDDIILLEKDSTPSIYGLGKTILWIGPIGLILGILLFSYLILMTVDKNRALKICGASLSIGSLILVSLPYLFKSAVLMSITNENFQVVMGNIYLTFANKLSEQTFFLFAIGILFLLIGYLVKFPILKSKGK